MPDRYTIVTPQGGGEVLCSRCHAEKIEDVQQREWFYYRDQRGGETMLPVLYHYNRCAVCKHTEKDHRAADENRAVIAAYNRVNPHCWSQPPISHCVECGRINPLNRAIELGLFDTEAMEFLKTAEGLNAQWIVARSNVFGCHIRINDFIH